MTDEKIAVGLKKQDTEALVCLMERYSNYISSIIGQLLKNYGTVQDTEELMADVFLTIWNTADKLNMDAYSSLKGYIGVKYNDTYIDLGKFTEKNAGVIFEVPETGSYEFSITNLSDERVFYTNTTIYQEVSSNEEN